MTEERLSFTVDAEEGKTAPSQEGQSLITLVSAVSMAFAFLKLGGFVIGVSALSQGDAYFTRAGRVPNGIESPALEEMGRQMTQLYVERSDQFLALSLPSLPIALLLFFGALLMLRRVVNGRLVAAAGFALALVVDLAGVPVYYEMNQKLQATWHEGVTNYLAELGDGPRDETAQLMAETIESPSSSLASVAFQMIGIVLFAGATVLLLRKDTKNKLEGLRALKDYQNRLRAAARAAQASSSQS